VPAIIGKVGPDTKAVEGMLRRIGFEYAEQIDPFDGGPHFVAKTDDITLVREAREVSVTTVEHADDERPWAVLAVETPGARPAFRALGARVIPMSNAVGIPDDARRRLAVEDGQRIWLCYG
jgi:arginine N-succinyltransferase